MRAILIDPQARSVEAVETSGKLDDIYRLVGCKVIEAVYLSKTDVMYVDEEGLLKSPTTQAFFGLADSEPICGRGLIFSDNRGENASTTLRVPDVFQAVVWYDTVKSED